MFTSKWKKVLIWIKWGFVCHLRSIHILLFKSLTWHRHSVSHSWEEHCPCRAASHVIKDRFAKADIQKRNLPSTKCYFWYKRENPCLPPILIWKLQSSRQLWREKHLYLSLPFHFWTDLPIPCYTPCAGVCQVPAKCLLSCDRDSLSWSQSFLLLQAPEAWLHKSLEKWQ